MTEIPELTDIVAMVALAPPRRRPPGAAPAALDDVPELTEAVEEIEIESIVELPEDLDESSDWLHHDHGDLSVVGGVPDQPSPRLRTAGSPTRAVVEASAPRRSRSVVEAPDAAPSAPPARRRVAEDPSCSDEAADRSPVAVRAVAAP